MSNPRNGGQGSRAVEFAGVTPQQSTLSHVALQYIPVIEQRLNQIILNELHV